MDQQENIDELIAKCLADEASVPEKEALRDWIAVSEANRKYYSDMEVIYKEAGKVTREDKMAVSTAWEKFSEGLPGKNGKKPVLRSIAVSFYSKAAAILALAGIGYFIFRNTGREEKDTVVSSAFSSVLSDTLPDGTFVSLAPGSTLTYSSSFGSKNRELQLTGEGYFHVQHNSALPFTVSTGNVFVKDIGTSFTIKARPADSVIAVLVEEGEVLFYSEQNQGISLVQNETGIYSKASANFRKKEDVDLNVQSGTMHTLSFEGASLKSIADTLNKVYNVRIVLSCPNLESLKLTATFTEATVYPIIETIAETLNLSVSAETAGAILLDSEACRH